MPRLFVLAAAGIVLAAAAPASARPVTLALDASYTHQRLVDAAPAGASPGDRQEVRGVLHDVTGARQGTFRFTCRYTGVTPAGARERCSARATTRDGRLRLAGPGSTGTTDHTWAVTGTSGALRGARGTAALHDATQDASIAILRLTPRTGVRLRAAVVPRPAANAAFVRRARRACRAGAAALAARPAFPLDAFDPLHPSPAELAVVGAYFSGPGDPRPADLALVAALRHLGEPPRSARVWDRVPDRIDDEATLAGRQAQAATAQDVPGFVRTVQATAGVSEALSFAARAFGAPACDL